MGKLVRLNNIINSYIFFGLEFECICVKGNEVRGRDGWRMLNFNWLFLV